MKKPITLGISAELDLPRVLAFCSFKSVQDFCKSAFFNTFKVVRCNYGANILEEVVH